MDLDFFLQNMGGLTLAGVAVVGAVNGVSIVYRHFKGAELSSLAKFLTGFVVALLIGFIPEATQSVIMAHIVGALTMVSLSSGFYKIGQKVGGE